MEFLTPYTEKARKGSKQTIKGPSMTEPDNAMSIPEIIARFTRGLGIPVNQRSWQVNDGTAEDIEAFSDLPGGDIVSKEVKEPESQEPKQEPKQEPEAAPAVAPAGAGA